MKAVERQTGEAPEALNTGEMPEEVEYLWRWFCRLSGRRQIGMAASPIEFSQIESFFRLLGMRPNEWEVQALELLDNAWLNAQADGGGQ